MIKAWSPFKMTNLYAVPAQNTGLNIMNCVVSEYYNNELSGSKSCAGSQFVANRFALGQIADI